MAAVSLFYTASFAPGYLSPWLLLLFLPFLHFRKKEERLKALILLSLMILIFMHAHSLTGLKLSLPKERISSITVEVVSDSMTKKNRKSGFQGRILHVRDRHDLHASGSGMIYAMSDGTELFRGDRVTLEGNFAPDADIFFSRSVRVDGRSSGHIMRSRARNAVRKRLSRLGEGAGELSMLLLLGEGDDPTWLLSEKAREKGVSHVFALSGMHLSLLCSFILPLLSLVLGKRLAKKAVILPLLFFTYTSSWRPSLVRAFLFRAVRTFTNEVEDHAFALTVILHGLLFPETLLSAGSTFSYLSVAALFYLVPKMDEAFSIFFRIRMTIFTTSLACLIATAPYAFSLFGTWSLSSLIFSPVVSLLVTLFMGETLLFLIFPYFPSVLDSTYRAVEWVLMREWGIMSEGKLELWYLLSLITCAFLLAGKVVKTVNNLYAERDVES